MKHRILARHFSSYVRSSKAVAALSDCYSLCYVTCEPVFVCRYFDGSSFHRLIPKFLTQTGGPSSSISELTRFMFDKESKQDEKLASLKITSEVLSRKIEVHSRLRFSHPGILAVAENQEKFVHQNQKDSFAVQKQSGEQVEMNYADVIEKNQFFITLGACDWLNNKHTVFGKVVGNSIYNLLKFNDLEMEKVESGEGSEKIASDKALDPPVIREIQIVESPFSEEDFPLTQLRVQHQSLIEEFKEEERKEKERIRKQNQNRNQSRKRTVSLCFIDLGCSSHYPICTL